jgi:small subunit ribosomal protein S2
MPYITERWPGGMLTNFVTIRKAVKKMAAIDRMKKDGTFNTLSKKERLQVGRLREKLEKNLGSISDMTRLPGALFVVDIIREHIAIKEAQKLNIPIFAMVDTNSDPREVEYVIPSNDDASKSITKILENITPAIQEGLDERNSEKENNKEDSKASTTEVKAEEVKVEETKVEGTKVEEAKVEEVKAEEVKAEEAKAEETKVEEAKAEETKAEDK